jgi:hypothetical protein
VFTVMGQRDSTSVTGSGELFSTGIHARLRVRMTACRLFFGLEWRYDWLAVVALDSAGTALLRARFPMARGAATELADAPHVLAVLDAFIKAHDAAPVFGLDHAPPWLTALARHLAGHLCYLDACTLERTAPPGYDAVLGRAFGVDAHLRALLAGLSVAGLAEAA